MQRPNTQGGPRCDDAPCRRILQAADYYEVIGVSRHCEENQIRAEFRQRAREVHPDKNSSALAEEAFKRLQKAHDALSDQRARRQYDLYGEDEQKAPRRRPPPQYYDAWPGARPEPAEFGMKAFWPVLLPMMFFLFAPAILPLLAQDLAGKQFANKQFGSASKQKSQKAPPFDFVRQLTKANADSVCGEATGKSMCVVLLRKPDQALEKNHLQLLEQLKLEAAKNVQNSRGQSLSLTWATVPAVGRWPSLLPSGATLPWVVVLKNSRLGPRVVALPLPPAGGKQRRRPCDRRKLRAVEGDCVWPFRTLSQKDVRTMI
eukprot:gnl/TRDRNA2_/TRDRNA2_161803_c0_seq8.p1 gnl/TRDRNA2_/TRDRNA2_161803_c0~~gnl/TRDRNA2_/TRDRNA2_161803_c0_seq8.p1  ORF type:complete len:317 (+),score=41.55 gnl/TRDRNA2_/TRDRNA2_161803_c0_seq8:60-1010(+)